MQSSGALELRRNELLLIISYGLTCFEVDKLATSPDYIRDSGNICPASSERFSEGYNLFPHSGVPIDRYKTKGIDEMGATEGE